jgi:hypothetical protein
VKRALQADEGAGQERRAQMNEDRQVFLGHREPEMLATK